MIGDVSAINLHVISQEPQDAKVDTSHASASPHIFHLNEITENQH